jgi:tritrans,polycis-undecaprenyl-diphosphate synthase [geranylgeranyl-diphosphate specific]
MVTTLEELKKTASDNLPKHIGLIVDGNRRWAAKRNLDSNFGHLIGYENLKKRLFDFFDAGIHYLSLYILSLENVRKRNDEELNYIYKIMVKAVDTVINESIVKEEKVRFNVIGRISMLPDKARSKIEELIEFTKHHDQNYINLCIMYDGHEEIVDAIKEIIRKGVKASEVDTNLIKAHLYTKGFPPLDYIIRTGMDDGARISGFLLWDSSYAEFKFRNDLWPDYNKEMVIEDLEDYLRRNRRMGK